MTNIVDGPWDHPNQQPREDAEEHAAWLELVAHRLSQAHLGSRPSDAAQRASQALLGGLPHNTGLQKAMKRLVELVDLSVNDNLGEKKPLLISSAKIYPDEHAAIYSVLSDGSCLSPSQLQYNAETDLGSSIVHENTGRSPRCPICENPHWSDCGHLVADIDITFSEIHGGELNERMDEFVSVIEKSFCQKFKCDEATDFALVELADLYEEFVEAQRNDPEDVQIVGSLFWQLILALFEHAGTVSAGSDLIDNGPPIMTSSLLILFAENPTDAVNDALTILSRELDLRD